METLIRFVVKRPYLPVVIAWAASILISIWGNGGMRVLSVVIYSLAALTLGTIRIVEEKKRREAGAPPPTTE
ncbi:hypothetical protein [Myxococcus sp. CA040A]|uniref:hypothetical protein n=1 Tax=Myxococcus sp. CA040A TaxID=2741738 RepID=UPI00157B9424|nr:hypothetical protein [Myxococcus sp. CA040A]NTX07053.1 hypothetical protein [Myxococcus sp. CA040A]